MAADAAARRVLVALDSACENRRAIDRAALLARRLRASLHGLFLEDAALRSLAVLPFIRQVSLAADVPANLEPEHVASQAAARLAQARRCLAAAAQEHGLAWSLAEVSGRPGDVLAGEPADLLVMQAMSRDIAGGYGLRSRWSKAAIGRAQPVLLLGAQQPPRQPITLALGPDPEITKRMLDFAASLIDSHEQCLALLSVGDGFDAPQLREWLAQTKPQIAIDTGFASLSELLAACRARHRGLLILDAAAAEEAGALQETVEKFCGDLLLAR